MSRGQQTLGNRRAQLGAPETNSAALEYAQLQNLGFFDGRGGFGSSMRFAPLPRHAQQLVYVPTTRNNPAPVVVPWRLDMNDPSHIHLAATHGFATGQMKSSQTSLIRSRRPVNLTGGTGRLNEEIRSTGVSIRQAAGHFTLKAPAINVTSTGANPTITIPGQRVESLNLAGYNGNVRFTGRSPVVNHGNLDGAAINFIGGGQATINHARTRSTTLNGRSLHGLIDAVGRHATNEAFDPTHGASDFTMPSRAALHRSMASSIVVGRAPAISNHLSHKAAAHIAVEMRNGHANASVSSKKRELDGLAHPQMA